MFNSRAAIEESFKNIAYTAQSFIRSRKREEAGITLGALLFWIAIKLPEWIQAFNLNKQNIPWHADDIGRGLMFTSGTVLFLYSGIKIFRLVYVRDLPPPTDRPSVIKGPMAFTEEDGALYRKLGRENDLQRLFGFVLDKQVSMIVVRGASGGGKTSLLRAGLSNILKDQSSRSIIYHYWEATPTEPEKGLLRVIRENWPDGVMKPSTLDELINPVEEIGRHEHVIVLDQFEQMRGNKYIFRLLRRMARESRPPHRITLVIAFRREFSADWMDFISPEQERGLPPPPDLSVQLFNVEQARDIIAQIIKEAGIAVEQSVVNNLLDAALIEGEISPVDIGIGLLAISELFEQNGRKTITDKEYQFFGGSEGLLTQYVTRCLTIFPEEEQKKILKALLALCDPETYQRIAEGLDLNQLAKESETDIIRLQWQLDRLEKRDTRLIETVPENNGTPKRYRLPHERLVNAIYRLTGKLLVDVDQARLIFDNAFLAWRKNLERSRYLLKGKDLKLVERNQKKIPWGENSKEKKEFFDRSKRKRFITYAVTIASIIAVSGSGWYAKVKYQEYVRRDVAKKFLKEYGYPEELYEWQHQLKVLELSIPLRLDGLNFLESDSIEELKIKATSSSNSISELVDSLSKCRLLKKLSLDLSGSQVTNLSSLDKLKNIQSLTLNLSDSKVTNLPALDKLKNIQSLTLDLSNSLVTNLPSLDKLKNIQSLNLNLSDSKVTNLPALSKLENLQSLTLDPDYSPATNLPSLDMLKNLQSLTLDLGQSQWTKLPSLDNLKNLQFLTLYLYYCPVKNLQSLDNLKTLQTLTLDLRGMQVKNLPSLDMLENLQSLTLDLTDSQVTNLPLLDKLENLQSLTLNLSDSQVTNLPSLDKIKKLQLTLDLSNSQVTNLPALDKIKSIQLTLDLTDSQVTNLSSLDRLENIQTLTLNLSGSQVTNLSSLDKLENIQALTLNLTDSQVTNLPSLDKLKNIQVLTLNLSESRVTNLPSLDNLPKLKLLIIDLSSSKVNTLKLPLNIKKLVIQLGDLRPKFHNFSPNIEELRFISADDYISNYLPKR